MVTRDRSSPCQVCSNKAELRLDQAGRLAGQGQRDSELGMGMGTLVRALETSTPQRSSDGD